MSYRLIITSTTVEAKIEEIHPTIRERSDNKSPLAAPEDKEQKVAHGTLDLLLGPMFAEKTTTLISTINRLLYSQPCLLVRYIGDNRYATGHTIATHGGIRLTTRGATADMAALTVVSVGNLSEVKIPADVTIVGIDEGQFYSDLCPVVLRWMQAGKRIIVAGLDGNYEAKPFGEMMRLVPYASTVRKLLAICMICKTRDAPFTIATVTILDGQHHIGGKESFQAVCFSCRAGE